MFENKDKPFEFLILNVTCILGIISVILRITNGFMVNSESEFFASRLTVDILVFLAFSTPIILSRFPIKFNTIGIPFCFAMMILTSINWFLNGGIEGTAEFSYLAMFFYFSMILSGRWLYFFISALILNEILILYIWYNPFEVMLNLTALQDQTPVNFITMVIVLTIGMLYFINKFEEKKKKLRAEKSSLSSKYMDMEDLNKQLKSYEQELNEINHFLEQKVSTRVEELEIQKKTIHEYMNLSLKEIKSPLKETLSSLKEICNQHEEKELTALLAVSGIELSETIEDISMKIAARNKEK